MSPDVVNSKRIYHPSLSAFLGECALPSHKDHFPVREVWTQNKVAVKLISDEHDELLLQGGL
jgi:hypothetical protein